MMTAEAFVGLIQMGDAIGRMSRLKGRREWDAMIAKRKAEGLPIYSDSTHHSVHWEAPTAPHSNACHFCTEERFDVPYTIGRHDHTCSLCGGITSVRVWANFAVEAYARPRSQHKSVSEPK